MFIASSASPSGISSSAFCFSRSEPARFVRFPSISGSSSALKQNPSRVSLSSALNFSKPADAAGSDLEYELQHELVIPQKQRGASVYVKLPIYTFAWFETPNGRELIRGVMNSLHAAGVEGMVIEVWWGKVEGTPGNYYWQEYLDLVAMARDCRLKVRAVMAFHQCCTTPGDFPWIPLPFWVISEMVQNPDLAYCDRFGERNREYISLGCDLLPVLRGRSPIQVYSDFLRSFRDTFREFLGGIITEIQLGMGPAGELRYPFSPYNRLKWHFRFYEVGEFQIYDRYIQASLRASAVDGGIKRWNTEGPQGLSYATQHPEDTEFFASTGVWRTFDGHFFDEWYSGMLLMHGERLCMAAKNIFNGTGVNIAAKLAMIYWYYDTISHPTELTAGYYNPSGRDGYLPIIRMFGRHGISLCCEGFEMVDEAAKKLHSCSSPEGLLRQLLLLAKECDVPLVGETAVSKIRSTAMKNLLEMYMLYAEDLTDPSMSLNFGTIDSSLYESDNWLRLCDLVDQMAGINDFQLN